MKNLASWGYALVAIGASAMFLVWMSTGFSAFDSGELVLLEAGLFWMSIVASAAGIACLVWYFATRRR